MVLEVLWWIAVKLGGKETFGCFSEERERGEAGWEGVDEK